MHPLPRRYLPSYSVLRSFESAARHESFTLAAKELSLTQSAISRQVKELEAILGVDMFRRVGRRVILTRAGQKLAFDLSVDLENIRRTVMRAISAGNLNSTLRVATLPGFASRWLVPRLGHFSSAHPNIEVSLSSRLTIFDLDVEHFDLAIHFGEQNWPNGELRHLCKEVMVPVASPDFVTQYGIHSLDDLKSAPLLHLTTRPLAWQEFFDQAGCADENFIKGKYFDQFSMIISGAVASLAAALIPSYLIEQELKSGALQILTEESLTTEESYYLVTPVGHDNQNTELFCAWIQGRIGKPVP